MTANWTVFRLNRGLGEHLAAWDALNLRLFSNHPLLNGTFVDLLLRNFDQGSARLCVLTEAGRTEAMCILRPGRAGIWTSFLPSQAQVGPTLMLTPKSLNQLMRTLPGLVTAIDFLCNDPAFGGFSDNADSAFDLEQNSLTMSINLKGGFENYWKSRSKSLTSNISRYERRLIGDQITQTTTCISEPAAIGHAVRQYAELESSGWKGKEGTALTVNNTQGKFYTDLLERFAESGSALVYELRFNAKLVASRLLICSPGMVVILKTAYDESYSRYAPGRLLLRDVIRDVSHRLPGRIIEFYTDANSDQLSWGTDQRWINHVSISKNAASGQLRNAARTLRKLVLPRPLLGIGGQTSIAIDVFDHPESFPPDVTEFFSVAENADFQTGSDWYRNLIDTVFKATTPTKIYVLRQHGHVVAALPIVAEVSKFGSRIRSLSNYYTSLYSPICGIDTKERHLALIIAEILTRHAPVISMRFTPLDSKALTFNWMERALQDNTLVSFRFFCFGNWYLKVEDDWQAYLKSRTGTLRSTIKRMDKKFTAHGGTIQLKTDRTQLEQTLREFTAVYAKSWKIPEPFTEFIPGLAKTFATKDSLRMAVAYLDGQPVASQLWIVNGNKASIFKLAYDENLKAFSPGTLVTAALMQHVIEIDQVTEVDYLTGDDDYKKTWMSDRRERWGLIAYNPKNWLGIVELIREITGRMLRRYGADIRKYSKNAKAIFT